MAFRLENDEGLPWTASTHFGWIVLIVVLTSGTAAYLLSLYLAVWIRSKGRSALPLYGFAIVMLAIPAETFASTSSWAEVAITVLSIIWIAAGFSLRHEIRRHFWESKGWDVEIGAVLTFFLSFLYINYCLNPITFDHKDTVTSLSLTQPPQKAVAEAGSTQP